MTEASHALKNRAVFLAAVIVELQIPISVKMWVWISVAFYRELADSFCYVIWKEYFHLCCFYYVFLGGGRSS